jgi:hypothetical protein
MCISIYGDKQRYMKLLWMVRVFAENFGKQLKTDKSFVDNVCQVRVLTFSNIFEANFVDVLMVFKTLSQCT